MYSFIMGEDFATLVNVITGNTVCIEKADAKYAEFVALIKAKKYMEAETIADAKMAFEAFAGTETNGPVSFIIKDGAAFYKVGAFDPVPLSNAITDRILDQAAQGFNVGPMMKFMANLLANPEKSAVDELYLFLEACKLPITEDGCFIAYKIIKENYKDIYTGTMDNSVGKVLSMPRTEVDSNRNATCSRGLHFCSKDYLPHYGTSESGARCILLKINPADVVSIPSDYKNAKGRAWQYEVVGEVADNQWRTNLVQQDFTSSAVVAPNATPVAKKSMSDVFDAYFTIWDGHFEWEDTARTAKIEHVIKRLVDQSGESEEAVKAFLDGMTTSYTETSDCGDEDGCENCDGCTCGTETSTPLNEVVAWDHIKRMGYDFNSDQGVWYDTSSGSNVAATVVTYFTGYTASELLNLIS